MEQFDLQILQKIYKPKAWSHKGQNGKLMIIGGSKLFHAASLWALTVASRVVDIVFYSSVEMNNKIVQKIKKEFREGIVVPRDKLNHYIEEADCILIGPGLPRSEGMEAGDDDTKELTEQLLKKYPNKKWVIDGGSLQVIDPQYLPKNCIITPHLKEFNILKSRTQSSTLRIKLEQTILEEQIKLFAKNYNCIVLLKGQNDIVCSPQECSKIEGGNAGMTKGGTGDVLAGLVAALNCKNDPYLAACSGSFFNKKAGDELFKRVGYYFNASDLTSQIPKVMQQFIRQRE